MLTMDYAQLLREFKTSEPFEAPFALDSQPKYAVLSLIISLMVISLALATAWSKRSFPVKLIIYTVLSFIGSLFCGSAAVFLANSWGVYV